MGRLIDGDELLRHKTWINGPSGDSIYDVVFCDEIEEAPTVEAIPKADYKNRLRADLKAILVELQLEMEELEEEADIGKVVMIGDIDRLIQQKINELKADQEGEK